MEMISIIQTTDCQRLAWYLSKKLFLEENLNIVGIFYPVFKYGALWKAVGKALLCGN